MLDSKQLNSQIRSTQAKQKKTVPKLIRNSFWDVAIGLWDNGNRVFTVNRKFHHVPIITYRCSYKSNLIFTG